MKRIIIFLIVCSIVTAALANTSSAADPNTNSQITTAADLKTNSKITTTADPNMNAEASPAAVITPTGKTKVHIVKALDIETIGLAIYPAEDLPEFKYRLLPNRNDIVDCNAEDLYIEAIESLPENIDLDELLRIPLSEFPIKRVETILRDFEPALKLLAEAAVCSNCRWEDTKAGSVSLEFLGGLKSLTKVIVLQSRLQIKKGQYTQAVTSIRTGLAMARHIAGTPNLVQGVVGIATASTILKQVEEFIQAPGSPSLFRSLQDLPQPFINPNKFSFDEGKREEHRAHWRRETGGRWKPGMPGQPGPGMGMPPGPFGRGQQTEQSEKPESSYSRRHITELTSRLDRIVAAMGCLEGIRFYATIGDGQFPDNLNETAEIRLPKDPITNRPFRYYRQGDKVILELPTYPEDKSSEKVIRYEIIMKQ